MPHKGTINAYTKAISGNNCLSSHSCHFVNFFFFNQTPSCICSMCLYCIGKYQIVPSKAMVGVDQPMKAPSMLYKSLIREKLSKFSLLSFCQKYFFLNQTPSCICSMCQHCIGKVSAVILSKIIFSEPNSFMHMFNVSTLYRQSIKLLPQKLW